MSDKKAMVLSSGGVNSTTCLGLAVKDYKKENVISVSIFYGQKHKKEIEAARKAAAFYKVLHHELDLSKVMEYSNCSLLSWSKEKIIHKSYAEQIAENGEGMVQTYAPFRNGLLISAVASLAMSIFPKEKVDIFIGAHADDAAGNAYADCSSGFVKAMDEAVNIGTYGRVHVIAPFVKMNKAGVVRIGLSLHVPYELTWSCYEGGDKPCGTCGTCIDRAAAFAANGVKDPALKD